MKEVRQFKLASGDEIVTEVVEQEVSEIEDQFTMVIRRPMKIALQWNENRRWYMLNPWMVHQDRNTDVIVFDASYIVAIGNPSTDVLDEYDRFCESQDASNASRYDNEDEGMDLINRLIDSDGYKLIHGGNDAIH